MAEDLGGSSTTSPFWRGRQTHLERYKTLGPAAPGIAVLGVLTAVLVLATAASLVGLRKDWPTRSGRTIAPANSEREAEAPGTGNGSRRQMPTAR